MSKNDFLFEDKPLPKNIGFSHTISTSVTGSATGQLTEESLKAAVDYLRHPDRKKEADEAAIRQANSRMLIEAAYKQKIINHSEYLWLHWRVSVIGALIVNKNMYDRLVRVNFVPIGERKNV